jgi:glutamate dehydrogenase/leucine dehydrogenase
MLNTGVVFARQEHERVLVLNDPGTGLRAVIAIHSTALGPAVGGLRLRPYGDLDEAVRDALRLSEAMSLKNAAAGLRLGGGKAVILDDGDTANRTARLLAFADAMNSLGGAYVTAEDIGTSPADMDILATRTQHVLGLSSANGGSDDPSPTTARTVLEGIREGVRLRLGRDDLAGLRVGIVGTGKVGAHLARLLVAEGAQLVLADVLEDRAATLADALAGQAMAVDAVLREELDVLAPCATGEMIDVQTVSELRCAVIAGGANNPLVDHATAVALHERAILFVPDFLANCGGMLNIAREFRNAGPEFTESGIVAAAARIRAVLEEARTDARLPVDVAREHALAIIAGSPDRDAPIATA